MPEKEVSIEQREAIYHWTLNQGGRWEFSFKDGCIGSGLHTINGEPLVLKGVERAVPHSKGGRLVFDLYCSDKHAQMLEEAGIVRFTAEPQQGAKVF